MIEGVETGLDGRRVRVVESARIITTSLRRSWGCRIMNTQNC
jgi:hypothetical protein